MNSLRTVGPASGDTGAAPLLDDLPKAQWLPGDRGYDVDCGGDAFQAEGASPASRIDDRATSRADATNTFLDAAAASISGPVALKELA